MISNSFAGAIPAYLISYLILASLIRLITGLTIFKQPKQ